MKTRATQGAGEYFLLFICLTKIPKMNIGVGTVSQQHILGGNISNLLQQQTM